MAPKKKPKKKSWHKTVLIYVFVPLTIWFLAFVAWLYWDDIWKSFSKDSNKQRNAPRAAQKPDKAGKDTAPTKLPQEKILEDDRKKLEDILKQRQ